MRKKRGFTLLEMCVCIIIFAVFLEAIWGFYTHIYINNAVFNQQVKLSSEGGNIEAFIRENMRDAEAIKIKTSSNTGEKHEIELDYSDAVKEETLELITVKKEVASSGSTTLKECSLSVSNNTESDSERRGEKSLMYTVDGKDKLVSDWIENIKVTKEKDSKIITFEVELCDKDEENSRLKYTHIFSESIAYKNKIS